jgi:hypothetical protein
MELLGSVYNFNICLSDDLQYTKYDPSANPRKIIEGDSLYTKYLYIASNHKAIKNFRLIDME